MVNINYQKENTTCDISKKNILRRGSDTTDWEKGTMGGHHSVSDAAEDEKSGVQRYEPDAILALRETSLSKAKPSCADDRPFWINSKATRIKKTDRNNRIGSGRLPATMADNFQPPSILVQKFNENDATTTYFNNNNNNNYYYREKTGREFYDSMKQQQNKKNDDCNVPFYNPVNRDHRRLLHEKSEENLPEWVNAGPISRFDTIDLHGFHDDKGQRDEVSSNKSTENKENRGEKGGKGFCFDEFTGLESFMNDEYNSYNYRNQGQSSRLKRHFNDGVNKSRDFHYQQNHPPPGFAPIQRPSSNFGQNQTQMNNSMANVLLDLLHRRGNAGNFSQNHGHGTNMSFMPSANELESIWRQDGGGGVGGNRASDIERFKIMEQNKAMLAGKSIVDVLDVLTQSQLRANAMPFKYPPPAQMGQNQWNNPNAPSNRMNKFQMARVLERQMMVQGQNPVYGGLTPQDPEYWNKIHQQQQSFYQQYERSAPTRQFKAKFHTNNNTRRVKFEERSKLEQFFNNHNITDHLPTIDPAKALKVEEFERKIKEAANNAKKHNHHH